LKILSSGNAPTLREYEFICEFHSSLLELFFKSTWYTAVPVGFQVLICGVETVVQILVIGLDELVDVLMCTMNSIFEIFSGRV